MAKLNLQKPKEPKKVTGLWLADARQEAIDRADACPVMTTSSGEEHEVFKGAKAAQKFFIDLANGYADRLASLVEEKK